MLGSEIPCDDDVARLLGLNDWRAGVHKIQHRQVTERLWANYLWRVVAEPSFAKKWVIAAFMANVYVDGVEKQIRRKAIVACAGQSTVADLDSDPVAEAFNEIELLRPSDVMSLDGICYDVRIDTIAVHGRLSFCNPDLAPLVGVEAEVMRMAKMLTASNAMLGQAVKGEYR